MDRVGGADSTHIIAERLEVFSEAESETPASGSNDLFYLFYKWGQLTINNSQTRRKKGFVGTISYSLFMILNYLQQWHNVSAELLFHKEGQLFTVIQHL